MLGFVFVLVGLNFSVPGEGRVTIGGGGRRAGEQLGRQFGGVDGTVGVVVRKVKALLDLTLVAGGVMSFRRQQVIAEHAHAAQASDYAGMLPPMEFRTLLWG